MRKLIMILMLMVSTMSYGQNGVIRAYAYAIDGKKVRSEAYTSMGEKVKSEVFFFETDTAKVIEMAIKKWEKELPWGEECYVFGKRFFGKKSSNVYYKPFNGEHYEIKIYDDKDKLIRVIDSLKTVIKNDMYAF